MDAEDLRDHMPCPGTKLECVTIERDVLRAEVEKHRARRSWICSAHQHGEDPDCMTCYGVGPQGVAHEWMEIAERLQLENANLRATDAASLWEQNKVLEAELAGQDAELQRLRRFRDAVLAWQMSGSYAAWNELMSAEREAVKKEQGE